MYLFTRNKGMIDVYKVSKDPELLKKYRQKILDKYQDQPIFYTLKTNVSGTVSEFKDSPSIDIESISYTKEAPAKKQYYSKLLESDSFDESTLVKQREVLNKYLNGEYSELIPSKVYRYDYQLRDDIELYYFIKPEHEIREPREWIFNNVIRLPRELFLLQLLEIDSINRIPSADELDEQLTCFTKEKIGSASMSELKLLIDTDLIRQSIGSVHERLDTDTAILEKIKEKEI